MLHAAPRRLLRARIGNHRLAAVTPNSRGPYVYGQQRAALEAFVGEGFASSFGGGANLSNGHQGATLTAA
jgi:hypothetical protein